ncbi:hypothetical protein D7V82_20085 [bacterium 1xD8-6]|nr:hypothetical protein D7V72_20890 [bacterium D16-36]RKI63547.1 hypothetical protein D7V82_20085 [bacterium 1xD8-6]
MQSIAQIRIIKNIKSILPFRQNAFYIFGKLPLYGLGLYYAWLEYQLMAGITLRKWRKQWKE